MIMINAVMSLFISPYLHMYVYTPISKYIYIQISYIYFCLEALPFNAMIDTGCHITKANPLAVQVIDSYRYECIHKIMRRFVYMNT